MKMIAMNSHRLCTADHVALIGKKCQCCGNGDQRYPNAKLRMIGLGRHTEPVDRAPADKQGRNADQRHLHERRKRLCLAMTEAVFVVSRLRRIANAEQRQ